MRDLPIELYQHILALLDATPSPNAATLPPQHCATLVSLVCTSNIHPLASLAFARLYSVVPLAFHGVAFAHSSCARLPRWVEHLFAALEEESAVGVRRRACVRRVSIAQVLAPSLSTATSSTDTPRLSEAPHRPTTFLVARLAPLLDRLPDLQHLEFGPLFSAARMALRPSPPCAPRASACPVDEAVCELLRTLERRGSQGVKDSAGGEGRLHVRVALLTPATALALLSLVSRGAVDVVEVDAVWDPPVAAGDTREPGEEDWLRCEPVADNLTGSERGLRLFGVAAA